MADVHIAGEEIGFIKIIACLDRSSKQHQKMYDIKCLRCNSELRIREDQLARYAKQGCPQCRPNKKLQLRPEYDLTGQTVKGYLVLSLLPQRDKNRRRVWKCRCTTCGAEYAFTQDDIKRARMNKCECIRRREFLAKHKEIAHDMLNAI